MATGRGAVRAADWQVTAPAGRRYHEATKHHPGRPSVNPRGLDWRNEPDLFKRYAGIEAEQPPAGLARLLRLGAGVHPRRGDPHFRTFMSAGALHPVELYVALESGLWHYHPGEGTLGHLRDEDPRAALARAAAAPELEDAGVVLLLTGILWRTAWKYGARGWRHVFWDAGCMLANLLALAERDGPRLLTAFVDAEVAGVLGVEPPREAPVALVAAGAGARSSGPRQLPPLALPSEPLSPREQRFPEAEEAYAGSALAGPDATGEWRKRAERVRAERAAGEGRGSPPERLEEVILRRGSARSFRPDPISRADLAGALGWACAPVAGDLPPLCSARVVTHAVEGLEPADRRQTAHVCLDQPHGGEAAAVVFFTADLDRLLEALGERGYRAAQLEAGIRAGRLELAAYARGLAATGLTFYDDEVRRMLGTAEEPMMCVAVGVKA